MVVCTGAGDEVGAFVVSGLDRELDVVEAAVDQVVQPVLGEAEAAGDQVDVRTEAGGVLYEVG